MAGPDGGWAGHVLVCGLHGLGQRIVEQLHRAGVPVVVIDDRADDRAVRMVADWGVPLVVANPRRRETLLGAGLERALAVVCVESEDLASLETALLVHRLRPAVRLVTRLRNPAVRRALEGVTGPGTVLDVGDLAAPSMVEACLRSVVHELDLGDTRFVLAGVRADGDTTLRDRYADLAPVAVVDGGTGDVAVCPGRDRVVHGGDVVHLIGTPEQFAGLGMEPGPALGATPRRRRGRAVRSLLSALVAEADRPLRIAVAAVLIFVAANTAVLTAAFRKPDGSHMTVLDGVYFSVETVTTIGYGDFNFAGQAAWLRVVSIATMIAGALLLASFVALLTNLLVSRRLEESYGRRRLGGMRGHVVVVGLGSVGLGVVQGIVASGGEAVVLERDADNRYLGQVRELGVPVVHGDATQRSNLEAVHLSTARAVAVVTSDDLTNIETGLAVRDALGQRWPGVPVVLRLFDRQLAATVERDFGFRYVRSTSELAAPWFVGAALGLDVLGTFYVEQQPFLVGRLRVASHGGLAGLTMAGLSASIRVVAIGRAADGGRLEHPPRRGTRFLADDVAYLVGPYEELLAVLRRDAATAGQA